MLFKNRKKNINIFWCSFNNWIIFQGILFPLQVLKEHIPGDKSEYWYFVLVLYALICLHKHMPSLDVVYLT